MHFKRIGKLAAVTLVAGYALVCFLVWLLQDRLLYFPQAGNQHTPAEIGIASEDVFLVPDPALPAQRIHGWFVPAPDAAGCVLFCHGNARNIGAHLDVVDSVHRLGLDLFLFDYRGYGQSDGQPSEQNMYADALAAWDYLTLRRGIPPGNIILQGRSLGGGVASWLAARVHPAGLVLESTFTSVPAAAARQFPFLPTALICRYQYSNVEHLRTVSAPALFVGSRDDELIFPAHIRSLYDAYPHEKAFVELRGTHNDCYTSSRPLYEEALGRFVRTILPVSAGRSPAGLRLP